MRAYKGMGTWNENVTKTMLANECKEKKNTECVELYYAHGKCVQDQGQDASCANCASWP